jgi:hypothetical protein
MGWERIVIIIAIAISSVSCASPSKVVPCGKDTYMLAMDDIWGGNSPSGLQIKAAEKANDYCASMGKVIQIRNASSTGAWGWTATSSNLIFSCLDANDPENTRPILRKEPDIVIENRKE